MENSLTRQVLVEKYPKIITIYNDLTLDDTIDNWWIGDWSNSSFQVTQCDELKFKKSFKGARWITKYEFYDFYQVEVGECKDNIILKIHCKKPK